MNYISIPNHLVAVLALLSAIGLLFRARREKSIVKIADSIPRLYIAIIYGVFSLGLVDNPATDRVFWVRYGLFSLLFAEVIYDLTLMYNRIRVRRTKNEKYEDTK